MAAQYITKSKIVKKDDGTKETITTKYRVDSDFVPTSINDISPEFIENYLNAKQQINWLLEQVNSTVADKNGKVRDKSFLAIRKDFVAAYFPTLGSSSAGTSWKDKLNAKYKK